MPIDLSPRAIRDATRILRGRVAERIPVSYDTLLKVRKGSATYEAKVSDITGFGFAVISAGDIAPRDLVELELPAIGWIAARVRWAGEQGRMGCEFLEPMDPDLFRVCLSRMFAAERR